MLIYLGGVVTNVIAHLVKYFINVDMEWNSGYYGLCRMVVIYIKTKFSNQLSKEYLLENLKSTL